MQRIALRFRQVESSRVDLAMRVLCTFAQRLAMPVTYEKAIPRAGENWAGSSTVRACSQKIGHAHSATRLMRSRLTVERLFRGSTPTRERRVEGGKTQTVSRSLYNRVSGKRIRLDHFDHVITRVVGRTTVLCVGKLRRKETDNDQDQRTNHNPLEGIGFI